MNFYIFNFKKNRNKKCFLLFFASLLVCYLAVNFMIAAYEERKTTPTSYVDIITSKYKHLQMNHPKNTLEIVFIGSSRSYFHIDTASLTKKGLPSYNLSMLACFPLSFPSMIENAKKVSPKTIGLGVDVDYFFNDFETRIPTPGIEDIQAQFSTKVGTELFARTVFDYIEKIPPLSRYSTTIATKIQSIFDRVTSTYFTAPSNSGLISTQEHDEPTFDTDNKIFQVQKLKDKYYSVKCENGDGILFGSLLTGNATAFDKKSQNKTIRKKNVEFMNYLISLAQKNGTNVFVYLCANTGSPTQFDLDELRSKLKAPVIDTVHIIPESSYFWGDTGHLNSNGRKLYTETLLDKIGKLDFYKKDSFAKPQDSILPQ
ncbi:hypothetical protein [Maridesulfovibrio frigidus]|uniref:hypothetical protein n=1 Tax=Maridesulfovibrio frigidus TaxID=340956 RepID=UPI0004E0BA38|nr:hypothetical protein [Maridesulfovibrio frigidus]